MKFAKCLENRRFPCYNNTNAKSVPSRAQANRTGSGRAYMNCAEIRRLPWLIRLLMSALLAALVLTPAPLALSASRTRPLSMLLLVLTAVLAKVLAPLVQSSRNNHSVPNPLCSVCCAGDFLIPSPSRSPRTAGKPWRARTTGTRTASARAWKAAARRSMIPESDG